MVRHHGSEDNTLGPDDCKAYGLGPVANTDTKLLIYGLFQKGRVLAQDATGSLVRLFSNIRVWISSVYSSRYLCPRCQRQPNA